MVILYHSLISFTFYWCPTNAERSGSCPLYPRNHWGSILSVGIKPACVHR